MLRQACPELDEGLSTNENPLTISTQDPFALSLSKGGGASSLSTSNKDPYILHQRSCLSFRDSLLNGLECLVDILFCVNSDVAPCWNIVKGGKRFILV